MDWNKFMIIKIYTSIKDNMDGSYIAGAISEYGTPIGFLEVLNINDAEHFLKEEIKLRLNEHNIDYNIIRVTMDSNEMQSVIKLSKSFTNVPLWQKIKNILHL